MRLIDAEKLQDDGHKKWFGGKMTYKELSRINFLISEAKTIEAIPIKWLESFKPLMTKDAYLGIKEAISQWNGDYEIIDEARQCIDSAFRKAMR